MNPIVLIVETIVIIAMKTINPKLFIKKIPSGPYKRVVVVAIVSWLFGWSLYGIEEITGWELMSDIIAGVEQNFYLKFFYDNINSSSDDTYPLADERIVIVNINGCSDNQIAGILIEIARKKPAVVGVDKLFSSHSYTGNDSLLAAIDSLGDKLVSPMFLSRVNEDGLINDNNKVYASYCSKKKIKDIGLVHLRDYYEPLDSLDLSGELMFDYVIARKSGYLSPDVKKQLKRTYINYRNKAFEESPYSKIKDLEIEQRIVLVGDLDSETEDSHVLPFKVLNHDNILSGLRLIAYSINSMITPWDNSNKDNSVSRAYCSAQSGVTSFISFLAILFFTVIYHLLYEVINKMSSIKEKNLLHHSAITFVYFLTPFLLLFIELCTVKLCFSYTETSFVIPNLLGLMFSYFCVSVVYGYSIYYYENK